MVKSATPLGVKGGTPGGVAFYGCTAKGFMVVQLKGIWSYNYRVYGRTTIRVVVVRLKGVVSRLSKPADCSRQSC